jgi:hypothetical protein
MPQRLSAGVWIPLHCNERREERNSSENLLGHFLWRSTPDGVCSADFESAP